VFLLAAQHFLRTELAAQPRLAKELIELAKQQSPFREDTAACAEANKRTAFSQWIWRTVVLIR